MEYLSPCDLAAASPAKRVGVELWENARHLRRAPRGAERGKQPLRAGREPE